MSEKTPSGKCTQTTTAQSPSPGLRKTAATAPAQAPATASARTKQSSFSGLIQAVLAASLTVLVFCFAFAPMLRMDVKGLPVVAFSADTGVETPRGEIKIGDQVLAQMVEKVNAQGALKVTVVDTPLDAAHLDSYYAALVIPADFSQKVLATAQPPAAATTALPGSARDLAPESVAAGSAAESVPGSTAESAPAGELPAQADAGAAQPTITLKINQGKNPLAASIIAQGVRELTGEITDELSDKLTDQLTGELTSELTGELPSELASALPGALTKENMGNPNADSANLAREGQAAASLPELQVEYYNPVPAALGIAGSLAPMGFVMLLLWPSNVGGLLLANATRQQNGWKAFANQLLGMVVTAAAIAAIAVGLLSALLRTQVPFGTMFAFSWIVTLALLALVVGCVGLCGRWGMAIPVCLHIISMTTVTFPAEFLPPLWRDWIYPWTPLQFFGNGVREVLYLDQTALPSQTGAFLVIFGVGVALMLLGLGRTALARRKAGATVAV
ncbi:YhgE/Pip N-terminal domain [Actinobaculum suis]|uniref:YhgE/Pip N-terminal domain n=1 Tax=Actinobaculum suis TaxID=1657 RepID=A0A7Z8Y8K6_9ACTO|nr:ABC transporter permease [Actinobaculum suis]VDG76213.1 YhgE/Pip N-terminal domain [Actinobaculum suis]